MLRKLMVALAISLSVVSLASAQVTPAIEATVGTGSKTAYLTLDFGTDFFTFAYKYNGTNVTAGDMITDIDAALASFSSNLGGSRSSSFGRFVNGFGYGTNLLSSFTSDFGAAQPVGWNYYVATSPLTSVNPTWSASNWGVDGRDSAGPAGAFQNLDTHVWNGFTWGQYDPNTFAFLGSAPRVKTLTAAAPEPGTLALLALGGAALLGLRRRARASAPRASRNS